jgi:hypothetical protein
MAIGDPITFAYDGGNITLNRVDPNGSTGSRYWGVGTDKELTLTVKHRIPSNPEDDGESHLVRLDVTHFVASTKEVARTASCWMSIITTGSPQDTENAEDAAEAIVDFMADAMITKIVGRQL